MRRELRRAQHRRLSDLRCRIEARPDAPARGVPDDLPDRRLRRRQRRVTQRGRADHLGQRPARPRGQRSKAPRISSYDQAQLVQVNDNNGRLFPVAKDNDGSYLVTDPTLFPDVKGWPPPGFTTVKEIAIGELRTTDVLTVGLENAAPPGGLVPYSSQLLPAGMAAYWSLAEVLRRAPSGCSTSTLRSSSSACTRRAKAP